MKIIVRKSASKDIMKINEPMKSSIKQKISDLENYPNVSNIKKLKNHNPTHRLRVGDYRVLFNIEEDSIIIGRIHHRKDSY